MIMGSCCRLLPRASVHSVKWLQAQVRSHISTFIAVPPPPSSAPTFTSYRRGVPSIFVEDSSTSRATLRGVVVGIAEGAERKGHWSETFVKV
jgi:hypothetical protein